MTTYAWPDWGVSSFELRVVPNLRTFTSPYGTGQQTLDLLGERWRLRLQVAATNKSIEGAAREAFIDRLKGQSHTFAIWHLRLPAPQGTLRSDGGAPVLDAAVAPLSNVAVIRTQAGRTVRAGDMLGLAGQLVRVMADATANGAGLLAIEFQPRARTAWGAGSAVQWDKPTANFMIMTADGAPTTWTAAAADAMALDAVEVP